MTYAQSAAGTLGSVSPELRFIIDFCNPARRHAPAPDLDWNIVVRGLDRHGLTRVIREMIAMPGVVPPGEVAALRELQHGKSELALIQLMEVVRICDLLDQAGVRFLLVKGIALSIQLYGQPGVRNGRDLDLLVEPGALARVDSVLESLGYRRPAEDRAKDQLAGRIPKEIGYIDASRGMLVEVHTRLTDNSDLYAPDFEALWETRETLTIGGRSFPTLGRKQLPIYLCAHGAKHGWSRLMWLLDIAALTGSPAEIDAALEDARRFQLENVVLHALAMLHDWFGHDVPPQILARAQTSRSVRILNRVTALHHIGRHWYEPPSRHSWRRFFLHSVLGRVISYTIKPKASYWRQQLSLDLVSSADRTIVALPPRFDWAYAVLRPFGWLIRRLRK